jgi:hypothetical protein
MGKRGVATTQHLITNDFSFLDISFDIQGLLHPQIYPNILE